VNNTAKPFNYLKILLQTDFIVFLKNKRALITSLVVPLYIIFITNIKAIKHSSHVSSLGSPIFLVVLAITIGILSTSITGYALIVARDRERGVFQRLRVTPAPAWTIMVSRLLVQVFANLVIAVVVLIVGSQVHHLSLSAGEYASVLLIATLGGLVFLSIGQALVGLVRSATLVNSIGSLLYVALLLSGLLGPSGALGSTFENISKWTPVGTVIAVFESALHQTAWDGHTWLSLLACLGYIAVCSAIGIKWFRWDANS
jgi:ABC-2 type transport system permease protein